MDIFLQILDGNWLEDEDGRLVFWYSQKCIVIRYLFRVNRDLLVYSCTTSTGPTQEDLSQNRLKYLHCRVYIAS